MKLQENACKDANIYNLVSSWRPLTRLILMLFATISISPIALFIFKLILSIENIVGFYRATHYINLGFYYFSFINLRFGGIILLIFFLMWKKGLVANILLASPYHYPKIKINNVLIRTDIYLTVIIGTIYIVYGFLKILSNISTQLFVSPAGLYDFFSTTLFAPISEEVYYRFIILYITASVFGRIPATFISTFFFVISHDLSQPYDILQTILLGFVNSLLVIRFGTLWPAIGVHIINNTIAY